VVRILIGTSVLWIALSAISDGVSTLVLPVRLGVDPDTPSASFLGLVTFVGLIAAMLVQPLVGSFSDRLRPRVGRQAFLAAGVILVLVGLVGLAFADAPITVGLAFLWLSIALSVTQAPQQALMPDLIPTERRGMAAGLKGFADLLGAMMGFALLGALLAGGDVRPALLALAVVIVALFGVVIILLRRATSAAPPAGVPAGSSSARAAAGLLDAYRLDLRQDAAFARAVVARFAFLLGTYGVGRFLVAFVANRLRLDVGAAAEAAGGVLAVLALVTAIGALPAGFLSDRWPRSPLMVAGAGASIVGVVAFAVAGELTVVVLGGVLMAIGSALFTVANWATLVDLAPGTEAGRYLGLANIGTAGAAAVAGLLGLLIDAANSLAPGSGFLALFAASAVAMAVSGGLAMGLDSRQATAVVEGPQAAAQG